MRALTHRCEWQTDPFVSGNNEVLAREGIDTIRIPSSLGKLIIGNNEVLAREGIDTKNCNALRAITPGNNEVLAREGIDTILYRIWNIKCNFVTMRY